MVRLDNIGPVNPPCEIIGTKYICLFVDHYSRFLFARGFMQQRELETMDFLLSNVTGSSKQWALFSAMSHRELETADSFFNNVTPIVGWPKTLYTNNGSHFVGKHITALLNSFGVLHFIALVSHPSSVGLTE